MEYDPDLVTKGNHLHALRNNNNDSGQSSCKFRTVIPMDEKNTNEHELIMNIHRLFRVNYIQNNVLRPTMDESSLSTLISLGQFTMCDIIRGVVSTSSSSSAPAPAGGGEGIGEGDGQQQQQQQRGEGQEDQLQQQGQQQKMSDGGGGGGSEDSYLVRIISLLGDEICAIREMMGEEAKKTASAKKGAKITSSFAALAEEGGREQSPDVEEEVFLTPPQSPLPRSPSPVPNNDYNSNKNNNNTPPATCIKWEQNVAPQDTSLSSRLIRRKGCILFLNELFNMARVALQQHEKDDFIDNTVKMNFSEQHSERQGGGGGCSHDATLLSYLSAILSDPSTDDKERGATLDILGVITMHDPSLIRRYCLNYCSSSSSLDAVAGSAGRTVDDNNDLDTTLRRPDPNDAREVLFVVPSYDLLLSLLYITSTESDAGLLLQASEIIRILLDTDIVCENEQEQQQQQGGGDRFLDEENDFNAANSNSNGNGTDQPSMSSSAAAESEQNAFLALFYDRYIQWLVAPFQYKIVVPRVATTYYNNEMGRNNNAVLDEVRQEFKQHTASATVVTTTTTTISIKNTSLLRTIEPCHVRASFTLEILCFCVRAHVHRMKFFMLRTRILGIILKMLCQKEEVLSQPSTTYTGMGCLKLASLK